MKLRLVPIAVLLASCLASAACDPATIAKGVVVDDQGRQLEGVEVILESEIAGGYRKESQQKTGPDGEFSFVTITGSARVVRLRFTKPGYKEETESIPALNESSHRIVLQKE